jgi:hypothetical protein
MGHRHFEFLSRVVQYGAELTGTYDHALVVLSLLIACMSAFAFLSFVEAIAEAESSRTKMAWTAVGALVWGLGVWSMHFIGMLAFKLPVDVSYDLTGTILSVLPAVAAGVFILRILAAPEPTCSRTVLGGLVLGGGIGAMHYLGMAAMVMTARMVYDPVRFGFSLLAAVALATAALRMKCVLEKRRLFGPLQRQALVALFMGLAVSGMHYIGMSAVHYFDSGAAAARGGLDSSSLAAATTCAAVVILSISISIMGIMTDRVLRGAARRMERLVESAPDAIVVVDPAGRIIMVNAQTEMFFGYDRSELLGQPLEILMPERLRAAHVGLRAGYAKTPGTRAMGGNRRLTGRRKDGSEFDADISLSHENTVDGVFVTSVIRDVSERVRLEQRLREGDAKLLQAQKMEALGRLAGGIAHDFNNNLSAILGLCDLLVPNLPPESAARRDVDEIKETAERSAALTRELLTFSRKRPANSKVYDVNDLIFRDIRILSRMLGANIRLERNLQQKPLPVRLDLHHFEQVIMNLTLNARDAIAGDGVITISSVEVAGGIEISVRDTGKGIEKSVLPHIFEPFYTTKGETGTGLGLATVYGIVAQSAGTIDVESEPGQGTVFRLRFPKAEGEPEHLPVAWTVETVSKGEGCVLVVEDNAAVRAVTTRCLASAGYKVLGADGAGQALELFEKNRAGIRLVLMDVNMPGTSGLLVAQKLKALEPRTKILFVSGYGLDVMESPDWPADSEFLAKPFSTASLAQKVSEMLSPD